MNQTINRGNINEKHGKMFQIIKQIQSKKITSNFPGVTLMKHIILNVHKDTIKWIVSCTTGRNIT